MRFALKYPDGKYVAVDVASGGYPYPVDTPFRATLWDEKTEIDGYNATISHPDYKNPKFQVVQIDFTEVNV